MVKHIATAGEMRSMSVTDLRKEIRELGDEVAKKRLDVATRSEKDTASFARSKKQFARMLTILAELEKGKMLNTKAKPAKVPAPVSSN